MGKERQNSLEPKFSIISQRMTEAWIKMRDSGQLSIYLGMNVGALTELRKRIKRGKPPEEGRKHIAEYLSALDELIASEQNGKNR